MAETTERVPVDFGDLLVALATDLDEIRQCVGCGNDSTWAGIFVHEHGEVTVTSWCDAPACEHDRTDLSRDQVLALPINHLPGLRKPSAPSPPTSATDALVCKCGHGKHDHSNAREDDFGCNVVGCWAKGRCQGWEPQ